MMASTNSTNRFVNGLLISAVILMLAGIGTAQSSAQAAATKEYRRLVNLSTALRKITGNNYDKEPQRSLLKRNDNDIVYSDPAGEWYVRSRRFWDLETKYHELAVADKIAWTAAENPLPGECEGYVNCNLSVIRMTYGEYLTRHPKGTYSKRAVQETIKSLSYMVDEAPPTKKNYDGPTESSENAEFLKMIRELRVILTRVSHPEKKKALSLLKRIEEAYK